MRLNPKIFETCTLELNNPLTDEQWDILEDVDFDNTEHIWFHTKHGKEVHFYKNAIPKEWMKKFANERALNDGMDCYWHFWGEDLLQMIEQWEKENKTN